MKRIKMTRRQLIEGSSALGFSAAFPSILGLAGCNSRSGSRITTESWREIAAPPPRGSITPRVTAMADGSVILSWLEPNEDGTAALQFSLRRDGAWSQPVTIAGRLLFSRDRASAPGVIALSSRNLIAYWSQKPTSKVRSANAIELFMAVSTHGGGHWASPALLNRSLGQPGEDKGYAPAAAPNATDAPLFCVECGKRGENKHSPLSSG